MNFFDSSFPRRRESSFLLAATLVFFTTSAHAESAQQALQKFLDGVQTFSASFQQVQKSEKGEVLHKTSGHMALSRPGKFRWAYEKPYQQLMVCNGKTIWLYDPDLKQVTVREAKDALAGTPAELLSQRGGLQSRFKIKDAGGKNGVRIVRLLPKSSEGDFQSIELWLKDSAPQHMRFHDQLGNVTDVSFGDIKTNAPIGAAQFSFMPPKGVEIVEAAENRKR